VFAIRGKQFNIEKDDIINAVKDVEPEPLTGKRKYYVEINGKRHPIKQVISLVIELPRIAFTAMDTYRILTKLGFEVKEIEKARVSTPRSRF